MAKKALPEKNIDKGPILATAQALVDLRSRIAGLETQEKAEKKNLAELAEGVRSEEEANTNYIGLIRVTGDGLPPIRVEFRLQNGALDVSQEEDLNKLFKSARPLLFGREELVTTITDPAKLLTDLQAQGRNPWDYLEISVKDGMHRVVSEWSDAVVAEEAFIPREGFLATVNDVVHTLTTEAKNFLKDYLVRALKAVPVIGTRGKA